MFWIFLFEWEHSQLYDMLREFQSIASTSNDNSLLSDQDTNQFLV